MERPGRPLGVSLAIVASVLVFTISPLLQVGLLFVVQQHFVDQSLPTIEGEPVISGGDIVGIPASTLIIQTALALIFLAVAILAWRGRPNRIRFGLIVLVIVYTAVKFASIIAASMAQANLQVGISSLDSILQSVSVGEFVTEFLVMVYVAWYLNRGPARAFYRGYYLPDPAAGTASPPENPTP